MADEAKLALVHDMVTDALIEGLKGQELAAEFNEDGEVVQEAVRMAPSAAIIAAATKFLKDNNITCVPGEDNKLGELNDILAARKERKRAKATPMDLGNAAADAAWLTGQMGNA